MKKSKVDLLSGKITVSLLKLTYPILLANIFQTLYSLTDAYFIGKIGGVQMASFFYVLPIVSITLAFGQGIGIAGTSLISIALGKGNEDDIAENVEQFFMFSLYLSLIIAILGYFYRFLILEKIGTEGKLLVESAKYMGIIFLDTPFAFIALCYVAIRKAEGYSGKASAIMFISVIVNLILTPLFIFKFNWGISGAAWSTFIAKGIAGFYCIYDLATARVELRYRIKPIFLKISKMSEISKIAIPSAISNASQAFGNVIMNSYIKEFGTAVLAAYGIGNKINGFFFMPSTATSGSISIVVGQNYGAGKYKRTMEALKSGLIINTVISLIGVAVLQIYAKEITKIFVSDEEIIKYTVSFIRVVSWTVLTWGIFQAFGGFFNGFGQTQKTMFISIFRLWGIRIPLLIIFYKFFDMRELSVWYAMFYSNLLTAIFSGVLVYKSSIYKEINCETKLEIESDVVDIAFESEDNKKWF